jgi:glucose-6-phosphate isomerase
MRSNAQVAEDINMLKTPDSTPEWQALKDYAAKIKANGLKKLQQDNFAKGDLKREVKGFKADYSSALIDAQGLTLLENLAESCDWQGWRAKLFAGEKINNTEGRAVYHMALRAKNDDGYKLDGQDVMHDVHEVLGRIYDFAHEVRDGLWRGVTDKNITDVVNIGIGGSDLGPYMVYEALKAEAKGPRVHYVSNVDAAHLQDTLAHLSPETTLFIITSKTFTTQETLLNARSAKAWMQNALGQDAAVIKKHFVAVSTNREAVEKFGIDGCNMFPFWDWVGGRFSLWSAVGLSCVIGLGAERFDKLLEGARAMDEHFKAAPFKENIPALMALLGVFYRNFLDCSALAILPYAQRLNLLPLYLQQLEMESNGKSVDRMGRPLAYETAPVIFGQPGTNGQHAFYQMLHQGGDIIPCDFIAVEQVKTDAEHHRILSAHLCAQVEALREGQSYEEALQKFEGDELKARHSIFSGGRPAHIYELPELDAYYIGMLLALYEHKVFMQGVIWNLNSFDQWGVQLGKDLSKKYV